MGCGFYWSFRNSWGLLGWCWFWNDDLLRRFGLWLEYLCRGLGRDGSWCRRRFRRLLNGRMSGGRAVTEGVAEAEENSADQREAEEDTDQRAEAKAEFGVAAAPDEFIFFVDLRRSHSFSFGTTMGVMSFAARFRDLLKRVSSSSGSGKTMVVFFSMPISASVCR